MTTMANHHVDPHLLVVLGATSDLMRRKLLPAIYRLRTGGAVPHFALSVDLWRKFLYYFGGRRGSFQRSAFRKT